jgi:AraC-like DNA-binding protein
MSQENVSGFEALSLPIFRFFTTDLPPKERFDAWRAGSNPLFDFSTPEDPAISYDAAVKIARLDDMMIGQTSWLHPTHKVNQSIRRPSRKIRFDGADHYYICLQRDVGFHAHTDKSSIKVGLNELCVLDVASQFDLHVTIGDAVFIIVPRDILPAHIAHLHGRTVTGGMGSLLSDYFNSLSRNLIHLKLADVPYITQATRNMLIACLSPSSEALAHASTEIDVLLRERIDRYIDEHLLSNDLGPDRICKDIGISRSKLYRIFEASGGIARQIQRKRLLRIRTILENPAAAKIRITEVAWRNGFDNEKRFSRAFKAEFGYTPREAMLARQSRIQADDALESTSSGNRLTLGEWMRQTRQSVRNI